MLSKNLEVRVCSDHVILILISTPKFNSTTWYPTDSIFYRITFFKVTEIFFIDSSSFH